MQSPSLRFANAVRTLAVEARRRYSWIRRELPGVVQSGTALRQTGAQLVEFLNRPRISTVLFVLAMAVVFQAVFAWATIFMDAIDTGVSAVASLATGVLPEGVLASFVVDGVIGGVGSVIIFLPQILILFLFIILMEDTGYLARAAFLVDRAMRSIGLSGQSVIPLLTDLSEDAKALGAVNTVVLRDGKRTGHNTDWWGFAESFRRGFPDVAKERVVQLGAGGAGTAVAHAALKLGVGRLALFDVETRRAGQVAAGLNARFGEGRAVAGGDLAAALAQADGLIHATPTGMARSVNDSR